MVGKSIQRDPECGPAVRSGLDGCSQELCPQHRVTGRVEDHRAAGVSDIGQGIDWRDRAPRKPVGIVGNIAGKDACQIGYVTLRERFDLLPVRPAPGRSVQVQFHQTDGEELHDLAGIVLIRKAARSGILALVPQRVQEFSHGDVQRQGFQEGPEVAKGVFAQDVPIRRHGELRPAQRGYALPADHKEFRQGEGQTAADAVWRRHQLEPDHEVGLVFHLVELVAVNDAVATLKKPVPTAQTRFSSNLLIQPTLSALRLEICNFRFRR